MKRVKCKSGLTGWQDRLHNVYSSFDDFEEYAEMYGLHTRLGFASPTEAWIANPTVQGSVVPSDYRRIK